MLSARTQLLPRLAAHPSAQMAAPAIVLVVALAGFSSPAGVVVNGILSGLITSLVAVAIAVVYRSSKVINFAAAELGIVAAVTAVLTAEQSGAPWAVGLLIAVVGGAVTGLVAEFVILRAFFRSPRLIVTVVTLGIAQLLTFAALRIPQLWDVQLASQRADAPFGWTSELGAFTFNTNHLAVVVFAPIALIAIAGLFRYTRTGVALRAIADLPDRAATLGIPVRGLQSVVWSLAGGLAALALFLEAGTKGLPLTSQFDYTLLLAALAAVVLGRFTHLPAIAASAMALGVLEWNVNWRIDNPQASNTALGVAILVALLFQHRRVEAIDDPTVGVWRTAATSRRTPRELRSTPEVLGANFAVAAVVAGVLVAIPMLFGVSTVLQASRLMIFAVVGLSLVVLTGWGGHISLGHIGFVALGAAVGGKAALDFDAGLLSATAVAGAVGAVGALIVGVPALRMRGGQLAVTTLAFAVAMTSWALNPRLSDWIPRERIERVPLLGRFDYGSSTDMYWVSAVFLTLAALVVVRLRRSRFGRTLIAVRDNPEAAAVYGVGVIPSQLTAFATSGFLASAAGSVFVHHQQAFDVGAYEPAAGIALFTAVVIGGAGSVAGGVIGIAYWYATQWWLDGAWQILATGAGVIVVLTMLPEGLASVLFRLRDRFLRSVANRRRLDIPSLQTTDQLDFRDEQLSQRELLKDSGLLDQLRAEAVEQPR